MADLFISYSRKDKAFVRALHTALIAQGHTSRQIANILNISSGTVETQRAMLNRKLDTTTSAGIVRYAIRNGLIEP